MMPATPSSRTSAALCTRWIAAIYLLRGIWQCLCAAERWGAKWLMFGSMLCLLLMILQMAGSVLLFFMPQRMSIRRFAVKPFVRRDDDRRGVADREQPDHPHPQFRRSVREGLGAV